MVRTQYLWADCPTCGAITEEPCYDLRFREPVYQYAEVHRDRPGASWEPADWEGWPA